MTKKATRSPSNIFSMFEKRQLDEFKEAFGVIDKDGDGKIDAKELKMCFEELGKNVKDVEIKGMIAEVEGPMNFNAFLQMFGTKLNGTDEEEMLLEAFKLFDAQGAGNLHKDWLKELLTANGRPGDRLSDSEFYMCLEGAPVDKAGNLDYSSFAKLIKNGKMDD